MELSVRSRERFGELGMPGEIAHEDDAAGGLLAILAHDWTWLVLCELGAEPKHQDELHPAGKPLAASTVSECLHRLVAGGLAIERRESPRTPHRTYLLARQGVEARPVREAAAHWEGRASPACAEASLVEGGAALRLLADRWTLPIMGCLAAGSRGRAQIARWTPGLPEATLDRRLARLSELGFVRYRRRRGFPARVEYQLTPAARSLTAIALLAICWEWRWGSPARPRIACDLAGLLRLIAPLVRIDPRVSGVCELTVLSASALQPTTTIAMRDGTIAVLASAPRRAADAHAQAPPLEWCDALITGRPHGLELGGSPELMRELVAALHRTLAIDWLPPPA